MKAIILPFLLSASLPISAQLVKFKPNESTRLILPLHVQPRHKTPTKGRKNNTSVRIPNYVLYRDVVRKFSWIEGVGKPISQEEANHLPYYYRLSMKNNKGHWQHIQAMHGDTLTVKHNMDTYIINTQYDNSYNLKEWRERFSKACQWYITSDLSDENVVEERAYDKNGYMVYGFQPVRNGKNSVVASYTDGYGYPIDIDESPKYTYGNVVIITYDEQGNDSIIDYLDGAGLRRANNDGVDQRRYEYDTQGRIIKIYSCNAVGDRMIDNWGNCGCIITYDAIGRDYTVTIVDTENKSMRMPNKKAKETETYVCCKYIHDKWGRLSERIFVDEKGQPDATLNGIHRIEYQYSDKGVLLSEKHYDLEDNIIK